MVKSIPSEKCPPSTQNPTWVSLLSSSNIDKAIDGNTKDKAARCATDTNASNLARTLTIELPVSQRVRSFKIFWERANIEQYTICLLYTSRCV